MIRLTHPDKPLYADSIHVTKRRLLDYWRRVAPFALPHLAGRPLSLVRCPKGGGRPCFFQRHHARGMPPGLRAAPISRDGKTEEFLTLVDGAGLDGAVQMDALELHIWGAHVDSVERPDRLTFDLDPDESLSFEEVKRAARDFRALLEAAGLTSFVMLTGGKGAHVVAPLEPSLDWTTLTAFARGVAMRLAAEEPARFTAIMTKSRRIGRIYVDYRRNERGASAIAPFSPRARVTPSVAAPIAWGELTRIERADAYTIDSMERRLASLRGDPWDGYFDLRQSITPAALRMFAAEGL
ncbi:MULTISPECIES: non-homologous end-joining DNA ligase [Methylosinus]|uniref:DNA polymerase LigD n=1 Tax=Methylosinus trichosporium (strain ATCC 35070 / NCIMB 11131 / UNIQEM 75 / OB3b) TaxID=595536 RepID=A0A2D2CWJ2_METT3|nr:MULTISPECIES: non-homologous end-joining DNA ligase [Methylosinus]ATQ67044.1 DNA polymerase LigD [Methylosinus trichosporium OB3b]